MAVGKYPPKNRYDFQASSRGTGSMPAPSCEVWRRFANLKPSIRQHLPHISGSFARGRCRRSRSEIPRFCSKLQLFALVLCESKRKAKKSEEKPQKSEEAKKKKKWENSSDPIYTNPIENLWNIHQSSGEGLQHIHQSSGEGAFGMWVA